MKNHSLIKKILGLGMTVSMTVMALAGCSTSSETTEETKTTEVTETAESITGSSNVELKSFKIAHQFTESGSIVSDSFANSMTTLVGACNGEVVYNMPDFTPDGCISYVENMIAAECDGIVICPVSDSILPTISSLCDEAGVYWAIDCRTIADDDIREMVEASEYYVGNNYEDEEVAAYETMEYLHSLGYSKIAIITQPVGDAAGDSREVGIGKACEDLGMEVVAEYRDVSQVADAISATESFLSAHDDLDCIYVVSTAVTGVPEAVSKAIQNAGRDVKVACQDWPDELVDLFETGQMVVASSSAGVAGVSYDIYMAMVKVINAIQGYPLSDKPTTNVLSPYKITSLEDAQQLQNVVIQSSFEYYDASYITDNLFKWNNPDLNQETLQEIINSYNPLN